MEVNGTDILKLFNNSRQVSINNSSIDALSQLDINGAVRSRSSLWVSPDTDIQSANVTERSLVSLRSSMTTSQRNVFILGRDLSIANSAIASYNYNGYQANSNTLTLGSYGLDNILTIKANECVGINNSLPRAPHEVSGSGTMTFGPSGPYAVYKHMMNKNPISSPLDQGALGPYYQSVSAIFNGSIFVSNGIYASSDRRLKKDIVTLDVDIERYKKFNPVSYRFKNETRVRTGLIAQEVRSISSELIELLPNDDLDDRIQFNVDYSQVSIINMSVIKKLLGC